MNRDELYELHARICQTLANPTRLKIIDGFRNGEQRVTDLADALHAPQSTVSRHLAVMRQAGVVQARREGQSVYYSLSSSNITTAYDTMHKFAIEYLEKNSALIQSISRDSSL
jgi:ArsR family transcriptional regulator